MKVRYSSQTPGSIRRSFTRKTSRLGHYSALAGSAVCLLWHSSALADLGDYQSAVTNEASLISYYTFEASSATDVHGTNNGALAGTASFAAGVKGSSIALSLDGAGHVDLGFVEAFTFTDQTGTVEAWVRADTLTENGCVFANREGFFESRWNVNMNQNKLAIGSWNGSVYETVAIPNASTNWHHLAVVYEDLPADYYVTVYWDGVPMGTVAQTMAFYYDRPTQIGSVATWTGAPEHWVGEIDEVAFYADSLTPSDILAHYQAIFIGNLPEITKQPQSGTYLAGAALTLGVEATGPAPLAYQWYKGAAVLTGQTNSTLNFPSLSAGDAGTYSATVSNTYGSVTSSNALVAIDTLPPRMASYQTAVSNETSLISFYTFDKQTPEDVKGPNEGTLTGTAGWNEGVGGGASRGLLLDGAGQVDLGSVPNFDFADGTGTVEGWIRADWVPNSVGYWPCMYANRGGGTVWQLQLSDSKNAPSFYNGLGSSGFVLPGGAGTNWHHFATVFTNGTASFYVDGYLIQYSPMGRDLGAGPGTVQLGSSASGSTSTGWIGMLDEVALYSDALPESSIQAHYNAFTAGESPVITAQPSNGYFLVGQLGQVSTWAVGEQALTYQWYKDGALLPGYNNPIIGPVTMTNTLAGSYQVVISNTFGSVTSDVANIYVDNNIANYQSTVLTESSLISYYTFDAANPQDSKNAHHGTNANSVAYGTGGPGGVTNASLTLAGNGHIDLGQVADFDFDDGTGTVEGWFRPDWANPAPYDATLFADRDGGSSWSVHVTAWKTHIGNFSTSPWGFPQLEIATDGNWHHYAIVFSSNTVSMYLDGKPRGSFSQPVGVGADKTTQIGSSSPTTTSEGWLGNLDEIAFYSDALDASEIWSHYLAMVGPNGPPTLEYSLLGTQLTLSWPVDVTGFALESAETLPGTSWTPVSGVVSNQVTVDASVGMQYYRLRQ